MQMIILIHPELLCIAKILSFGAEQRAKEEKKEAQKRKSEQEAMKLSETEKTKKAEQQQSPEETA